MKYIITYWLTGQSRLFSEPQRYETNDKYELQRAISICKLFGYEIQQIKEEC